MRSAPVVDQAVSADGQNGTELGRYRVLVAGCAVSSFGSYLNMVALNLYIYLTSHSALTMGAFMATRLAAGLAGGLTAGPAVARWGPRGVMLACNTAQVLALGLLVVSTGDLHRGAIVLVAILAGAGGTTFLVAFRTAIPAMVGESRRLWANSLLASGRSLAMVGGFLATGVVVSWAGYRTAFLVDAASFLACSIVVALLCKNVTRRRPTGGDADTPDPATRHTRSVLPALRARQGLVTMILLRAVDGLGSSSHNAALPVYSAALDPHHAAAFISRFWACWAAGNLIVQQLLRVRGRRTGNAGGMKGFVLGTMTMSASFIALFCGSPMVVMLGIAMAAGMSDGFTEVAFASHLQSLPEAVRGYAFGMSATVENLGFGGGMVISASLLERFTPLTVVGIFHGLAICMAVGCLATVARRPVARP